MNTLSVGRFLTLTISLTLSSFTWGCQTMSPKTSSGDPVQIHGHRGSRGTHPENTLPAFAEAVAAGADVLELDLQLTADDVPVVSHDPQLTGEHCLGPDGKPLSKPVDIRRTKAADLKKYDCGSLRNPRFPEQKLVPGTRIPTLEEFLEWTKKNAPKLDLNIETKMTAPDPALVAPPDLFTRKVVEAFRRAGVIDRVILQSFDFRTLEAARKLEPKLRLSCLFETEKDFCARTKKIGARYASPFLGLVTREEVDACHEEGIEVVPWTANKKEEWKALLEADVDAIITDYPRKLADYLDEEGLR